MSGYAAVAKAHRPGGTVIHIGIYLILKGAQVVEKTLRHIDESYQKQPEHFREESEVQVILQITK